MVVWTRWVLGNFSGPGIQPYQRLTIRTFLLIMEVVCTRDLTSMLSKGKIPVHELISALDIDITDRYRYNSEVEVDDSGDAL